MAGYGYPPADSGRGMMRAADADRDRVAAVLSSAFAEGRLSKTEYDDRLTSAMSARTFADLDRVVIDLPTGGLAPMPAPGPLMVPTARTNGLATASLVCGLAQFVLGPLPTIPAIVLGHMARGQIKRTGEQGAGLALAGLLLGWGAVVLFILAIAVAGITFTHGGAAPGGFPQQGPP